MQTHTENQELIQIEIIRLGYIIRYARFSELNRKKLIQTKINLKRKEVCNG